MLIKHFGWINILLTLNLICIFSYYTFYKLPVQSDRQKWTKRCSCCVSTCCPKKIMKRIESTHSVKKSSWRSSSEKMRSSYKMSVDGEDDELKFERSELFVGPPIKSVPSPQDIEHVPNVSDVGSLGSTTSTGSISELVVIWNWISHPQESRKWFETSFIPPPEQITCVRV